MGFRYRASSRPLQGARGALTLSGSAKKMARQYIILGGGPNYIFGSTAFYKVSSEDKIFAFILNYLFAYLPENSHIYAI
jgi:hypothetical protein